MIWPIVAPVPSYQVLTVESKRWRLVSSWWVADPAAGYENGSLKGMVCSWEFLGKREGGPAGLTGWCRQELSGPGLGLLGCPRRTHRSLHPRRWLFRVLARARMDNSIDRPLRSFMTPDLLTLDDPGLHGLTAQQSADLYELILNRYWSSASSSPSTGPSTMTQPLRRSRSDQQRLGRGLSDPLDSSKAPIPAPRRP